MERAFQAGVGGGCSVPLGVNARLSNDGRLTVRAVYGDGEGTILFREKAEGEKAEGEALVEKLLAGLRAAVA
jgi:porphobilinogen deaminase